MAIAIPGTALSRDLPCENMGRAKSLTDSEKQVVLARLEETSPSGRLPSELGALKNAVHNVIAAPRTGEIRHRRGGKRFRDSNSCAQ